MRKYLVILVVMSAFVILGFMTVPKLMGEATVRLYKKSLFGNIKSIMANILKKYQVIHFMIVGGIGYLINMGVYYPLTLLFQNKITFLGQQFYLPPFVISSLVAILCNYWLNKKYTFKGQQEKRFGFGRYLFMASATLLLDMVVLFALVEYGGLQPIIGAALAIFIVFIIRFLIAKYWIWGKNAEVKRVL